MKKQAKPARGIWDYLLGGGWWGAGVHG